VLGEIRRVGDDQGDPACELNRQGVVPVAPTELDSRRRLNRNPRQVGGRDLESGRVPVGADDAHGVPFRRERERDHTRARAEIDDEQFRSDLLNLGTGQGSFRLQGTKTVDLGQGESDDDLSLRTRDEHARVDDDIEGPEPPVSEHVLERLT